MEMPPESDLNILPLQQKKFYTPDMLNFIAESDPVHEFSKKLVQAGCDQLMLRTLIEYEIPTAIKTLVRGELENLMQELGKQFKNELREAIIYQLLINTETPEGRKQLFEKMFNTDYYYE